jgi:diadenosine tetraphosphate (Ap4A) HIT family hydrolase
MSDQIEAAFAALELPDPVVPEEPREGDPGGPACGLCTLTDADAIWSNSHWRATSRSWSPIPGGVLLVSKEHADSLSDMPRERQAEFGTIAAAIETAIMDLGGAARVHLYRWGDGRAHFHAHFIPRPLGLPQFGVRNLPFLEYRFAGPGPEERQQAARAIGSALSRADLPE